MKALQSSIKIGLISIGLLLIKLMPLIDTASGILTPVDTSVVNIGQIYRLLVFAVLILLAIKNNIKRNLYVLPLLILFMIVQCILNMNNVMQVIIAWTKLITSILIFITYSSLIEKKHLSIKRIYDLLDLWAILYPIAFIMPKLLGIDIVASYDSTTGYKGAFYAVNEISFVLSVVVMYLIIRLDQNLKRKYIVLLVLNIFCIILLGTKSSLLVVLFFGISFVYRVIFIHKKQVFKRWFILVSLIVAVFIGWCIFYVQIQDIIQRLLWQREYASASNFDFLTSGRIRRIEQGFLMFTENPLYILFGWGLGLSILHIGIEMDFIDLLFGVGIIGFICIMAIYSIFYFHRCEKNYWNNLALLTASILCCFAGHILYYGQSGMALGVLFLFLFINKNDKNNRIIRNYTE